MKYIFLLATVLWFVFMTYLSHQNGQSTAETSLRLAELLGDENLNGYLRRVAHVVVFLVLAVLLSLTLKYWDFDWRFVLLVCVWSLLDEATKPLIDGRHFAWFDVGLNVCGSVVGIIVGMIIRVVP